MGKMKIIIIIIIVLVVAGAGAFYFYNKEEANKDLENDIIPLAEDYFDNYMSANTGSNIYEVTLADLRKAVEENVDYDLSEFSDCEDDSSVKLTIDYGTGKVIKTEVELNCK